MMCDSKFHGKLYWNKSRLSASFFVNGKGMIHVKIPYILYRYEKESILRGYMEKAIHKKIEAEMNSNYSLWILIDDWLEITYKEMIPKTSGTIHYTIETASEVVWKWFDEYPWSIRYDNI